MRFTRIRASRSAVISTFVITLALIGSMIAGALERDDAVAQGVDWLSADSVSYLTSSGIPVMVPSWIPGPVNGVAPEIYAGGGSYSIYFYAGSSFLFISGEAGGGFPGGSEANLNVELSVNASVQGWPAIQDIGIPAGTPTPIYDKVMWIANDVMYTVTGNGLDTDSLTLANSAVTMYAPAPVVPEPSAPEPAVQQPVDSSDQSAPVSTGQNAAVTTSDSSNAPVDQATTSDLETTGETASTTGAATTTGGDTEAITTVTAPALDGDGTSGAWFTGGLNADLSDGTDGANPPFLGNDGTGGPP